MAVSGDLPTLAFGKVSSYVVIYKNCRRVPMSVELCVVFVQRQTIAGHPVADPCDSAAHASHRSTVIVQAGVVMYIVDLSVYERAANHT